MFYNFTENCRSKRVRVLIYYIGKGYFLTGHSEKGYQFQNGGHTVKGKFSGPLFTHRYTVDQKAPPGVWPHSACLVILKMNLGTDLSIRPHTHVGNREYYIVFP